ncbi:MAG: hypothetical protein ACKVWR_00595 [Acidimicrobiales bacterium]
MAKSSATKKAARLARSGGRAGAVNRRSPSFPLAVLVICVLGVALVAYGAMERRNVVSAEPALGQHWHSAYGIYACGDWVANLTDRHTDELGIHTHNDGLIHIHPFSGQVTGNDAKLGRFFEMTDVKMTDSALTLPDGVVYDESQPCPATSSTPDASATLRVARFAPGATEPTQVYDSDFDDIRFEEDGEALTIAFVAPDAAIPPPPSVGTQPTDVDVAPQPGENTVDGAVTTSTAVAPADPNAATTTAGDGASTTTAAPGATTTTAPAR